MAKVAATTKATVEVGLSTRVKAQVRVAAMEITELQRKINEMKAKQEELKEKIQNQFVDADEIDALMNGTDVDGYKVKMVCGSSSRLDKKLLVTLGCDPEWLEQATKKTDNKPYVRITAPGESSHDE